MGQPPQLGKGGVPSSKSSLRAPFILFSDTRRDALKREFPSMSPKDVTTRLGKEWNELSEESKRPFKEQYRRAREQWMAEHPGETIWAPKDSTNRKRPRKGGPQPNVSQGPGVMGVHGAWTLSVPCWSGQVPIPVHPQNVEKLQLIDAELSRIPGPLTDEVILQTVNSVLSPATPGPPWTFGVFL